MRQKDPVDIITGALDLMSQVVRRLVSGGDSIHSCPAMLVEVSQLLSLLNNHALDRNGTDAAPLLKSLQRETLTVQQLLDAAASLYCGSLRSQALVPGVYTSDGYLPQQTGDSGHFNLRA